MTREEAIKHLETWLDERMWRCFGEEDRKTIRMAIEALKGGDAEVNETKSPYMQQSPDNGADVSAEADRPHVEWIETPYLHDMGWGETTTLTMYKCDKCGEMIGYKSNYCPHCGAKMKGGDTE